MRRIVSSRMSHTITSWSGALNQVFVVLPTGENGVRISRSSMPEKKVDIHFAAPRQLAPEHFEPVKIGQPRGKKGKLRAKKGNSGAKLG